MALKNKLFDIAVEENSEIVNFKVSLNNGYRMPVISFGTFCINGQSRISKALDVALQAGYRSIDTASVYGNEKEIGIALKKLLPKYKLSRRDIFITTKLAPGSYNKEGVIHAVNRSLENLDASYIDLYLIHYPGIPGPDNNQLNSQNRINVWNSLVSIYDNGNGPLKSIGVSNFTAKHIGQLLQNTLVIPAVNQVEFHPHWQQPKELQEVCKQNKILLQAYSPLGGRASDLLLGDPLIESLASKYKIKPAQVLLRWALQRSFAIAPKSETADRIIDNAKLDVPLNDDDVQKINNIGHKAKYAWNPERVS